MAGWWELEVEALRVPSLITAQVVCRNNVWLFWQLDNPTDTIRPHKPAIAPGSLVPVHPAY